MANRLGYRAALDWLLDNDDCEWLDSDCPSPAVTLCLVADLFGIDTERAITDLRRRASKRSREHD